MQYDYLVDYLNGFKYNREESVRLDKQERNLFVDLLKKEYKVG